MSEGMKPMTDRQRRSFLVEQRALIDETPSIERRLPLLSVPTVVVHGTSDHIVPLGAARILAAAIPGAELSLAPGQGHMMPFERPDLIAALVRRYSALAER
jgi:pimeloyl-ACP methyl ester carboxylesterase